MSAALNSKYQFQSSVGHFRTAQLTALLDFLTFFLEHIERSSVTFSCQTLFISPIPSLALRMSYRHATLNVVLPVKKHW
jgi:hypothetical protein